METSSPQAQRGFTIIEIIIVIVIASAIGFAVWFALKAVPVAREAANHTPTPTVSLSVAPEEPKQYLSPFENASITYPSTWKENGYGVTTVKGIKTEDQRLIQPEVNVGGKHYRTTIQFTVTDKTDPIETAPKPCTTCEVTQVIPFINAAGYPRLTIVVGKTTEGIYGIAVTDRADIKVGDAIFTDDLYFSSRRNPDGRAKLRATYSYPQEAGDQAMRTAYLTEAEFRNTELSAVPINILKSLMAK